MDAGRSLWPALETIFRIINEQTHQPVENPAMRALREGFAVGLANHTILISKDGTELRSMIVSPPSRASRAMLPAACCNSFAAAVDFGYGNQIALHRRNTVIYGSKMVALRSVLASSIPRRFARRHHLVHPFILSRKPR